jgi:hypothetical protein
MDGTLQPVPAQHNGRNEAVTVTPAFFADGGWLAPSAAPRLGGATWLRQMQYLATLEQLDFLVVCQWNEFAGQPDGSTGYTDSYNVTLSNDMEPTSLDLCGYVHDGDARCGGWGFYYLNLLAASLEVLYGSSKSALVVLEATASEVPAVVTDVLSIRWVWLSVQQPLSGVTFTIDIDGTSVSTVTGVESADIGLAQLELGKGLHRVTVTATNAWTVVAVSETAIVDPVAADAAFHPNATLDFVYDGNGGGGGAAAVASSAVGFVSVSSPAPYQYGPAIVLVGTEYHMFFCSPGDGTDKWDYIRHSSSEDAESWATSDVALMPSTPFDANSVCDPSVVQFRGVWLLYHTCINTQSPPDGYRNNRICVAMADKVAGPYSPLPRPIIEDLNCTSDPSVAYCVGQPTAVVVGDAVYLFYSSVYPGASPGPNPGVILAAVSADGVNFQPLAGGQPLYVQRDVDIKYDRTDGVFVMVQGDVGSTVMTWSVSVDGTQWLPYNTSSGRDLATNPSAASLGGSNNNPGLAGLPDGSIGGDSWVLYGSSYAAGWAHWSLYRSNLTVNPAANDCSGCARNSCDEACARVLGAAAWGQCAHPGSRDPAACCECTAAPVPADCHQCAPGGCVAACRAAGAHVGICARPGSADPAYCCACL